LYYVYVYVYIAWYFMYVILFKCMLMCVYVSLFALSFAVFGYFWPQVLFNRCIVIVEVGRWTSKCYCYPTYGKPSLKGAWFGHVNHINLVDIHHISGTADSFRYCQRRWTVSVINWRRSQSPVYHADRRHTCVYNTWA